jgi:hypothetical protein
MKRTILAVVATLCSLTAIGQYQSTAHQDQWLTPSSFYSCAPTYINSPISDFAFTTIFMDFEINGYVFDAIGQYVPNDTTIIIEGIAVYLYGCFRGDKEYYVQIRDSLFNELKETKYYPLLSICQQAYMVSMQE